MAYSGSGKSRQQGIKVQAGNEPDKEGFRNSNHHSLSGTGVVLVIQLQINRSVF